MGLKGLNEHPADAHDAVCPAWEMSAPGADLGSAKRRGDVGLKGLSEHPLMLMMLAVWRWKCQRQVLSGDVGPKGLNEHPLMLMMLAVWRWKCQHQALI